MTLGGPSNPYSVGINTISLRRTSAPLHYFCPTKAASWWFVNKTLAILLKTQNYFPVRRDRSEPIMLYCIKLCKYESMLKSTKFVLVFALPSTRGVKP